MTINTAWFVVLAMMLAGYAVLDGFDLGVGMLHLFVGRTSKERGTLIDTIGPVWNGNEVWLLAAGGAMVAAFPRLYAVSFSGFYLALMLVLWLLLLRGLAIEFRHQIDHELWQHAWDVVFAIASTLLALLFGVAFANVLRGVPLDANGTFQGSFAVLLNPFALLGGVLSVVTLALHGAGWIALKTDGDVQARARRIGAAAWLATVVMLTVIVGASFVVRPVFTANFLRWPWLAVIPLCAIGSVVVIRHSQRRADDRRAFLATAATIAATIASAAAGMYPALLPAATGSLHNGLDIYNASSPPNSLRIALGIYLFGMTLVGVYLVNVYRVWKGKVKPVYH